MLERKIYIYVLVNPLNNEVFYVGYTNNPTRRLNEHIGDKYNNYKDAVIEKIINVKLKPELKIIDECDYIYDEKAKMCEHERLEIKYIKKYRDAGVKLTNLTDGGGLAGRETIELYCYDENGEFMRKYNSLTEASENVHVSISKISLALNQKINKSSANRYWFTTPQLKENIVFRKAAKRNILILQYSLDGIFLNKFNGQGEAEKITGIKSKLINKCLRKNGYNQAGGYMWYYENKLPETVKKYIKNNRTKSISQYDLNCKHIANYESISDASIKLNIPVGSISSNLIGKSKMSYGYIFTYVDEEPEKYIDNRRLKTISVLKYNINGDLLNEYSSINEASFLNKTQQTSISANLRGKNKTAGGFVWKYKNNYDNNIKIL